MRKYKLNSVDRRLIEASLDVLKANFDDGVYNHTVGCALLCGSGKIYTGVNCDGIHGSCAEYITLGTAISAGEREFVCIVASNELAPNGVVSPCGNCRQMFMEYCPDIKVILNDDEGRVIKVRARDLLPYAWKRIEAD